ncbi:hypothetical protein [Alkalicoccobacillus porphyridii]|uniref:Uncharacterized protein n=1 Tax=Alkalicoccobacillus porphyridii TaxID=2597270 RepID=A0A554A1V7_9BACI|nr:hypothetical protein [Alkalicoccobacillus porphyridii]TSB47646.1 hypothetical protein FN960_03750 [Alkalicoccobacillus porphyridii]
MKKFSFIILTLTILMWIGFVTTTQALTFDQLPQVKQSDHWIVSIKEAKNDPRLEKPNPRKFDTYELEIQNKSGQLGRVMARVYRDEPDSTVRYGLAILEAEKTAHLSELDGTAIHPAISVSKAAKKIEVDVLWTTGEEGDRPYKETFIFSQE